MTLDEINTVFKAHSKKMEQRKREIYLEASLIASFVWSKKIPEFDEVFHTEEEPANNEVIKELFIDYMNAWNTK